MDNQESFDNRIRHALDARLSGIVEKPASRHRVLLCVRGEIAMKRKISIAFVVVLLIVLIAGVAWAAISLRNTARQIVETEQTDGLYKDWPVEKKISLVSALADMGYIEETSEVKQLIMNTLPEKEADLIANEAVGKFTGMDVSEISFLAIMQAAWGPFGEWTKEEQAWYSQLMVDMGIQQADHTLYVMPEGSVDEAAAIAIARRAIAKGFGVEESVLDSYTATTTFEVPEFAIPGVDQPYWHVDYHAPEDMPENERLFRLFSLCIHPETGELYESVESMLERRFVQFVEPQTPNYMAISEYSRRANWKFFCFWPLKLKAEYSKEINPMVKAMLDSGDLTDLKYDGRVPSSVIAQSTFTYGLPGDKDIPQEKAFELVTRALEEAYDLDPGIFGLYREICVYFDVTEPVKPLWKFIFNSRSLPWRDLEGGWDDPLKDQCYKAEIDAHTGDAAKLEEFQYQVIGQDLEYDLKWQ